MREEEALREFKKLLWTFLRTGRDLSTAWEDLDQATSQRMMDVINEQYPFPKDFHEVLMDMARWDEVVQRLQAGGVLDWRPK
jgi:hypothetical protein